MRDKIAEALFEIDAWGISFDDLKANPNFNAALEGYYRRADAILALEVDGKEIESGCKRTTNSCHVELVCPLCDDYIKARPATIGDLIGS